MKKESTKSIYISSIFCYITNEYLILLAKQLATSPKGGAKNEKI